MEKRNIEFIKNAETVLKIILSNQKHKELDVADKRGGYLSIFNNNLGKIELVSVVGEPESSNCGKYLHLSIEKSTRLFNHIEDGHLTSYESQSDGLNSFPGAVFIYTPIISFSGLPALIDEALCLIIKLMECASVHRLDFHRKIISQIYGKRPNQEGLEIYARLYNLCF